MMAAGIVKGQALSDSEKIEQATAELTERYQLTEPQQEAMQRIQERRLRNLADIEPLREQDYQRYLAKLKSLRQGTENSIERLLDPDQREIFYARRAERRKEEAAVIKEMRTQGASKEAIQRKLLEMEDQ